MKGKDPTRGKDGIDGGYFRLSDFFLRALVKIQMTRNVAVKKRISETRDIFRRLGFILSYITLLLENLIRIDI